MRLVGCVRVSRVAGREGESFISPQQQRDRIIAHAAAHGHTMIGWEEDLDQPGTRMDRPGLEAAMLMVERGEADGIAVAKLDRFARSVPGAAKALQRLEGAGGVLVAVDLGMDSSTPAGKMMRNMLLALAEFEVDRIRENWKDASARAVGRGVHAGRIATFGYVKGEDGRLVVDEQAAEVVREAFAMRARGESWKDISRMFDMRAPRGDDRVWPWQTIAGMINRRTYLGEAFTGDTVNPDAHEPIVDRDLWERAQPTFPRPPKRGADALLQGIIRCAACGYLMSRAGDGARGYINYRCTPRHASGDCPEPARISTLRAEEYVTEQFLRWASDSALRDSALNVSAERAVDEVDAAEAELAAYRDGELVSVIGQRVFIEGLELRARRVHEARTHLRSLRRADVPLLGSVTLADEWERLTIDERRELIAAGVDAVFIRRAHLPGRAPFEHRVWICWAGDGPADLPGRMLSGLRPFVFPVDRPGAVGVPPAHDG